MKLSLETYILRQNWGDEAALRAARTAGFDCVDYSFYWADPDFPMYTDGYAAYARKLRALMDEIGLECRQAHAPFRFQYGMAMDDSEPAYREITRAIKAAGILGVKDIVVHSVPTPTKAEELAYNLTFYRSLENAAARAGVRIAVENLFWRDQKRSCFGGRFNTPAELSAVVAALGTDHFTACIDIGHASLTGLEPQEFITGMTPGLITSLHVQDNDYLDDRHQLPYQGKLNWDAILSALRAYGYAGDMNFEIFGYLRRVPSELLPDALALAHAVGRQLIREFEA